MSLFGIGGFNFQSLVSLGAQAALAASTGGASVAAQAIAKQLVSAIVSQVLQNVGQKLGLPQSVIDGAQAAFSAAAGNPAGVQKNVNQIVSDFSRQAQLSPSQQGDLQRAVDKSASAIEGALSQSLQRASADAQEQASKAKGRKAGNFLEAIALALGDALDQKFDQALKLANDIAEQTQSNSEFANSLGSEAKSGDVVKANAAQSKLGGTTALFQSVNQEIGILQNVIKTALDAIGGAQSTIARRN
ncbi:MAG: hypothetical protein ACKVOB_10325 [Sphingomonas sp.]